MCPLLQKKKTCNLKPFLKLQLQYNNFLSRQCRNSDRKQTKNLKSFWTLLNQFHRNRNVTQGNELWLYKWTKSVTCWVSGQPTVRKSCQKDERRRAEIKETRKNMILRLSLLEAVLSFHYDLIKQLKIIILTGWAVIAFGNYCLSLQFLFFFYFVLCFPSNQISPHHTIFTPTRDPKHISSPLL